MATDLQVVLKVAERCNINCTYCYCLNSDNDAPYGRPAAISEEVARGVVRFVEDSARHIDLGQLRIVLHGGEPLMVKKNDSVPCARSSPSCDGSDPPPTSS